MLKQIVLPLLGVIAFIALVGFYFQKTSIKTAPVATPATTQQSLKRIYIADKIVNVEIASSKEARQKGLSGVTTLDANTGLLFIFDDQNVTPSFWMKDTLIPLDIIWINDGRIVKIDKNIQPPKEGTPDTNLTLYSAGQPIDFVLELNGGYTDNNNVRVGDAIDLSKI